MIEAGPISQHVVTKMGNSHVTTTSPDLEKRYLDFLQAPRKEWFLFERSGHLACFEEPQRFLEVMLHVQRAYGGPSCGAGV